MSEREKPWKNPLGMMFLLVFILLAIMALIVLAQTIMSLKYSYYYLGVKQENDTLILVAMGTASGLSPEISSPILSYDNQTGTILVLKNVSLLDIEHVIQHLKINGKDIVGYEPVLKDTEAFSGVALANNYDIIFYVATRR